MDATHSHDALELIRKILLVEWDPIGIAEFRGAADEYDSYVPDVYGLLARRASADEVCDYLWWLETKHMGLVGDRQRTAKIAERLIALVQNGALLAPKSDDHSKN